MSLEHAILGFLDYGPLSGYDLKKVFDVSVQHFWPADQSQIYRTLSHLEEQGWVEVEVVNQIERPDRKVYHITEAGREGFLGWLALAPRERASRSAALIQVFFFGQLSNDVILEKFEQYLQMMKAVLARYEQVPENLASGIPVSASERENFFWMLTLDLGFRTVHANIEWAESVIDMLKKDRVPQG
jgi:DNA-binding PadR family transcriptional regulator